MRSNWRMMYGVAVALVALVAGCADESAHGKRPAGQAEVKLNAGQTQAAMKMAAAAQKAYEGLLNTEAARPRSLPGQDVEVEWSRNWLSAELLLHPAGAEAQRAVRAHADRMNALLRATQDRVGSEAGAADAVPAADYAVADAEYDLAALNSTGQMTSAMTRAAQQMVADAKKAALGADGAARGAMVSPELFERRISWSRRQVRAETLLEPMAVRRLPLLQAHWDRVNRLGREARADRGSDASLALQAEYGLAEADFMLEMNAGNTGKMTPEQSADAQHLAECARAVWERLHDQAAQRGAAPAFSNLLLLYSRRWAEADMRIYPSGEPRRSAVEDYVKRSTDFFNEARQFAGQDPSGVLPAMGAYAMAEGEYWQAAGP